MGFLLGCNTSDDVVFGDGRIGGYSLGDASRLYCRSTTPESRDALRELAGTAGLSLVDYCLTFGVPLTVIEVYQGAYDATQDAEPGAVPGEVDPEGPPGPN